MIQKALNTTALVNVLASALILLGVAFGTQPAAGADVSPEGLDFFEKKVRPILVNHCYECHSAKSKKVEGSFLLDARDSLIKGGDSGPGLVPGDPDQSLFITAVRQTDKDLRMPPKQKLSASQIADLETWVKMGAPDPRTVVTAPITATASPKYGIGLEEGRKFWSFQPVQDYPLPKVKDATWPRTPVDDFILARLESAGVTASPTADKRTLLRRVTFDLTGLPPTPGEMNDFLADTSSQAFEKVVDRLLDSPRYGERWGRHWLDVVRYADTCGNSSDYPVPQAHKYRDWVIRAFNRDMPYDQFLREQLAGDLLPEGSEAERYERITATGYLAIAKRFGGNRKGDPHLTVEDTIDNLGRAVLGYSIACARCHDHKFDPITMSDYYGLYGIFSSTRYPFPGAEVVKKQEDFVPLMRSEEIAALLKPFNEKVAALEAEIKQLEVAESEAKKAADSPDKKAQVEAATKAVTEARKKRTAVQAEAPIINSAYAVVDAEPANAKVHLRGDPKRLGDEVPRHFPNVLGGQELPADCKTSGRLQLAEWLTDAKNPLTARVMVNRLWQYHFGQGIVRTSNDFGRRGTAPSHPELLDYLAARFVANGWSVKAIHKLILLSHTWQLASTDVSESAKLDPNNELFWKFTRHRLDAEAIRDTMLFVSGDLDEQAGGAHPFPPQHTWQWTQHSPFFAVYETKRRSVYLMQQRFRKNPYLALFDGADPSSSTGVRLQSTTPLQALFLMNDPFAHSQAKKFADRVTLAAADEIARIDMAYQIAMNRSPTAEEQNDCADFLKKYREKLTALKTPADQLEAKTWAALARAIMSTNEFVFVD